MGLKRKSKSNSIIGSSFAPYMGLKSFVLLLLLPILIFAPYMGLKSDNIVTCKVLGEFAPYMGLKSYVGVFYL